MEQTAIVTGANGWLGRRLTYFLVNGYPEHEKIKDFKFNEVRCLVLPGEDTTYLESLDDKVKVYRGDITKPQSLNELFENSEGAHLFVASGIIHPKSVKQFYQVNTEGTLNVMKAALEAKAKKAVVISSNSPIGCNPFSEHVFDENSDYNPYMNYGKSKMLMEKGVKDLVKDKELPTVLIRTPWFYGVNQPPRQTLFFQMIKDGKMPIVGNGENRRSMSFIDNLCQGVMLAAIHDNTETEVFWIADEKPYSMNEIVDTVEDVLKSDFNYEVSGKRFKLPWIMGEFATWADWTFQKLGLYIQKVHVLSEMNKTIACDVSKAKKVLGYKPGVALREGMKRSIAWCLENGQKI